MNDDNRDTQRTHVRRNPVDALRRATTQSSVGLYPHDLHPG